MAWTLDNHGGKSVHLKEIMMHQVEGAWSNILKSAEDIIEHLGHSEGQPAVGIVHV